MDEDILFGRGASVMTVEDSNAVSLWREVLEIVLERCRNPRGALALCIEARIPHVVFPAGKEYHMAGVGTHLPSKGNAVFILAERILEVIEESGFDHKVTFAALECARSALGTDYLQKLIVAKEDENLLPQG